MSVRFLRFFALFFLFLAAGARLIADEDVILREMPDYTWFAGSLSTACGNLVGYWDRHGLSDFYTNGTANGIAPLNSFGNNSGIRSMWVSAAGLDGQSYSKPGHIDDYWGAFNVTTGSGSYESTAPDPYLMR